LQPAPSGSRPAGPVPRRQSRPAAEAGTEAVLVWGKFTWDEDRLGPLMLNLPPVIHIKGENQIPVAWLNEAVQIFGDESAAPQPGSHTIMNHLSHVIFVRGIRACFSNRHPGGDKWLECLSDRQIGQAFGLIHGGLDTSWTVASLARHCGMSRSAFAVRFARLAGLSPMRYVLEQRMRGAVKLLRESCLGLKEISDLVGYGSEAAFSNAFKRWAGIAPGMYRTSCLSRDGICIIRSAE
jgi:AraC-like DNA-binding protein